jgi:hypothetical protein
MTNDELINKHAKIKIDLSRINSCLRRALSSRACMCSLPEDLNGINDLIFDLQNERTTCAHEEYELSQLICLRFAEHDLQFIISLALDEAKRRVSEYAQAYTHNLPHPKNEMIAQCIKFLKDHGQTL